MMFVIIVNKDKTMRHDFFRNEVVFLQNQFFNLVKTGWTLLRLIAVVSSSIVTILSSLIPLFLHTSLSPEYLFLLFIFLSIAAITVHGGLTHLFNDYADFLSDTDANSPAILSGGSRVIQKKLIQPENGSLFSYSSSPVLWLF